MYLAVITLLSGKISDSGNTLQRRICRDRLLERSREGEESFIFAVAILTRLDEIIGEESGDCETSGKKAVRESHLDDFLIIKELKVNNT